MPWSTDGWVYNGLQPIPPATLAWRRAMANNGIGTQFFDVTQQNNTQQNKTKQNKTNPNKTRQKTRQNAEGNIVVINDTL